MKVIIRNGQRTRTHELGKLIAQGGAGAIYLVVGHPDLVAKIYMYPNSNQINFQAAANERERIEAMLARAPSIQAVSHGQYHQLAWPLSIVESTSGQMLGFTMPKLALDKACDLESLITKNGRRAEGLSEDYRDRIFAARNMATLIREIHKEGHYIVDMKPKNMSIYKPDEARGLVAILDSDGFSINSANGKRFPATMFSSEYIAPELLKNNSKPSEANEYQDRWAMAVIIFRLLNNSTHPYTGVYKGSDSSSTITIDDNVKANRYAYGRIPHKDISPRPGSIHEFFDDDTRELFDRAFSSRPHDRPTAKDWREHLQTLTDSASSKLIQCRNDPLHWHFSKGCPFCNRNQSVKGSKNIQQAVPKISKNYNPNPTYTIKNNTTAATPPTSQKATISYSKKQATASRPVSSSGSMNPIHTPPPTATSSTQSTSFKLKHLIGIIATISLIYYLINRPSNTPEVNTSTTNSSHNLATAPQISNNSNSPNKYVPVQDKFRIVKKASSTTAITAKSIATNELATQYFADIVKDIVYEFNNAKLTQEDGLSIYQHVNLSYLRKITFSGHESDSCKSNIVGTIGICMIEGTIAKCQFVEEKNYKATCLYSFE